MHFKNNSFKRIMLLLFAIMVVSCTKDDFELLSSLSLFTLGDSTTFGAGSSTNTSWSDRLSELGSFQYYKNLAQNGAFCMHHPGFKQLSSQVSQVPNNTKGFILIMIGTNDFFHDSPLGSVEEALSSSYNNLNDEYSFANSFRYCMIKLKNRAPEAKIFVMQPLPSNDVGNINGHYDETNLFAIRDIERKICQSMNIPIIESQDVFGFDRDNGNWNYYFKDFCHPNDNGYELIACCMWEIIRNYIQ